MDGASPSERLAREPAPPYVGEGRFALWHVSEEPSLHRFLPRAPVADPTAEPLVWAVDTRHLPLYWFPRDCPRACLWPVTTTTAEDRDRFFEPSGAERIHVIEAAWLARVQAARLFAYRLPPDAFRRHEDVGGYWVADEPVDALERATITDLLGHHAAAAIELRIVPSIWPFWRRVVASSVEFSGCRLRNAGPDPGRMDRPSPERAPAP